jgi:para-aminobenzoate synthetase/4-amino-4-deoxychorismate lyase
LYNSELRKYRSKGFFDVIFFNEKNQLAEGTITNIFIKSIESWYTPATKSGILPGVYRKYLLSQNRDIKETFLTKDDLFSAQEVILTNSLRGKIEISKLYLNESEFKEFI